MPAPTYRIAVRDPSLTIVAEADHYSQLTIQPRFNALGAWVLDLPADTDAAAALDDGCGILVVRNGQVVFSGPMTHREDKGDDQGETVSCSGYDDLVFLQDRLAKPCASPYTAQTDDVRAGPAESVLKAYVQANTVAGGAWVDPTHPAVTGLVVAPDLARGSTVTGRARFQSLLDLLFELALAGGDLGFRVIQTLTTPPTLQFQVYVPADRTATAVFSRDFGNLRSYGYTTEAPTGNAITVGGQGTGNTRTFLERTDPTSIATYGRRVEAFVDQGNAATLAELQQSGDNELAQRADRGELTLEPLDTAGLSFLAPDPTQGYQLGDKVTVVVRGVPVQDVVREVKITLAAESGEVLAPTIGTPGARLTHTNTYVLRHLHRRLSLQERR